jgi:glycosyltransferase 2 family protein
MRNLRSHLRTVLPIAVGLAALAALIVGVDPRRLGEALSRFRLELLPLVLAASAGAVVLQGVRWHFLLRELGLPFRMRDSVLLSVAGQAITAILPLGDLTRVIFVTEADPDADFGPVAATVTIQELTYTLLLVLMALPGVLELHQSPAVVVVTVLGIAWVVVILTVPPVFHAVHVVVGRTPLINRFLGQIDELQRETVVLLHRPDTLAWTTLDLARAVLTAASFWLILQGLDPGAIDWWQSAFVLAVSYVGGAVSLIPGGAGANEATTVGALLLLGLPAYLAVAAAILQRLVITGTATVMGLGAYVVASRRYNLSGLGTLRTRAARSPSRDRRPAPAEPARRAATPSRPAR